VATVKRKKVCGLGIRLYKINTVAAAHIIKIEKVTQIYLIKLIALSQKGLAEYTPIQCLYVSAAANPLWARKH